MTTVAQKPDDPYPVHEPVSDELDLFGPLLSHWRSIVIGALLTGVLALAVTYLLTPRFTARTSFLPPQQQQGIAAAALGQLGALAGLAGAATGLKSSADQYIALMQSVLVSDRIVDRFGLIHAYEVDLRVEARERLAKRVSMTLGRKDGLITVQVEDVDPQRAADMANRYVEELRTLTGSLALTEAQQRRVFFETELKATGERLAAAQSALQASGFNSGALKAEPKAAAESYARLRAELTAAEVRLQALRRNLADGTPEVQQQQALIGALRSQLARAESASTARGDGPDYVGRYRDFKYHETLFELFARQFELARLDESREGALIQVIDVATAPERKSWPRRGLTAVAATVIAGLLLSVFFVGRQHLRQARATAVRVGASA